MAKLTLTNIENLQNETTVVAAINANNDAIEAAMENTLSRDGTSPNTVNHDIDMNSFRITNLPKAISEFEPVRKHDLDNFGEFVAPTVEVGTTTTLPSGSQATVTNVGTGSEVILDFGIPQGTKGDTGAAGSGTGNVIGPAMSEVNRIVTFNSEDGTSIKDSGKDIPTGAVVGTTDTQTLTNKTIAAGSNTISGLTTSMFATNTVDTDGTLAANSDTRIASQKATKTYVDTVTDGIITGDGTVLQVVQMTASDYAALTPKVSTTLYIIVG